MAKFEFTHPFACPVTKRKYKPGDSGAFDPEYALRLESWKLGEIMPDPEPVKAPDHEDIPAPPKPKPAPKPEPPKKQSKEFKAWRGRKK